MRGFKKESLPHGGVTPIPMHKEGFCVYIQVPGTSLSDTRLKQTEPVKLLAHDCVAFADGVLQFGAVLNGHVSSRIVDKTCLVEHSRGYCYRRPRYTQHVREKVVSERHSIGLHAVMARK